MPVPLRHDNKALRPALVAVIISLLVFVRAVFCDFINWDDPFYVLENPAIKQLDWSFFQEAFTTTYMGWWMPLTWISLAIDYYFWGVNPVGYHLTNVVLHAVSTALVVMIADQLLRSLNGFYPGKQDEYDEATRTTGWKSSSHWHAYVLLLSGLVWALHPLRVESVVWVTERKDVLNGVFSLGTIYCYLRFFHQKCAGGDKASAKFYYMFSLGSLLLSLMAKPVSVVIPVMLLVTDWYPLKRFKQEKWRVILLEKVPFLVLVTVVSLMTLMLASGNQLLVSYQDLSLGNRFLLAGNALFEYGKLSLYPVDIINIYLLPWPLPLSYTIKTVCICCVSLYCIWNLKRRPWLPAAWLSFVLPLVPVLGFFQNGAQSHAARFTYLPAVLPSICGAALIGVMCQRLRHWQRAVLVVTSLLLPLLYAVQTYQLIGAWKNPETLWSRVIAIQPIGRAYYLRADYFAQKGRYDEAADDLLTSITMGQKAGYNQMFNLHARRGDVLNKGRRYTEAVQEFTKAIYYYPHPTYYYHRGLALQALGRVKDAEGDFGKAGANTGVIEWQKR